MRPVQMVDIEAAARAVCVVAAHERADLAKEICLRADVADRYRKRLGRQHPEYGSGSVMSAASRYQQVLRPQCMTLAYLDAIVIVGSALRSRFCHQSL